MIDLSWLIPLGYAGAFLASLLGCATFIIPIPYTIVLIALAPVLDPFFLSLFAGVGAALGEFVAYGIGWGVLYGKKKLSKKRKKEEKPKGRFSKFWDKLIPWFSKWFYKNGFLTILLFAATPLPDDFIGFIAGTANYNKRKFIIAALIGKLIMSAAVVYAAKYGIEVVLDWWAI